MTSTAARAALGPLSAAIDEKTLTPAARRTAKKGLDELDDALGPDAYWRARTWKRVFAIFAGPGTNLLFAIVLFAILFMVGKFVADLDRRVGRCRTAPPRPPASAPATRSSP